MYNKTTMTLSFFFLGRLPGFFFFFLQIKIKTKGNLPLVSLSWQLTYRRIPFRWDRTKDKTSQMGPTLIHHPAGIKREVGRLLDFHRPKEEAASQRKYWSAVGPMHVKPLQALWSQISYGLSIGLPGRSW